MVFIKPQLCVSIQEKNVLCANKVPLRKPSPSTVMKGSSHYDRAGVKRREGGRELLPIMPVLFPAKVKQMFDAFKCVNTKDS